MSTPLSYLQEISFTDTEIITPVGTFDRATSRVELGQWTQVRRVTGVWIALAVLLIPCTAGLSLFLLLIKENTGELDVPLTVTDGRAVYRSVLHARDWDQYLLYARVVNWAMTSLPSA